MELKHSAATCDMLVSIYNFMVKHNLEMTASGAYLADRQISIGTASQKFYDKFIAELDYIKELSKNQPVVTIKFKPLFYSEKEGWIELPEETDTLKTFDLVKANAFIQKYQDKHKYKIECLVINDIDVLLAPNMTKSEIVKQIFGE
jgi:hypothetical protein